MLWYDWPLTLGITSNMRITHCCALVLLICAPRLCLLLRVISIMLKRRFLHSLRLFIFPKSILYLRISLTFTCLQWKNKCDSSSFWVDLPRIYRFLVPFHLEIQLLGILLDCRLNWRQKGGKWQKKEKNRARHAQTTFSNTVVSRSLEMQHQTENNMPQSWSC